MTGTRVGEVVVWLEAGLAWPWPDFAPAMTGEICGFEEGEGDMGAEACSGEDCGDDEPPSVFGDVGGLGWLGV